jgi:hypothetical protein
VVAIFTLGSSSASSNELALTSPFNPNCRRSASAGGDGRTLLQLQVAISVERRKGANEAGRLLNNEERNCSIVGGAAATR